MKNKIATLVLLATTMLGTVFSLDADAKRDDPKPSGHGWICYAQGFYRTGSPAGDIPQTTSAYGRDQQDAMMNALNRCYGQGLSQCMMQSCFRR